MDMKGWQPMETAPKDGTEVLGWRRDCGIMLVRYTSMAVFMTDSEIEETGLDEETVCAEDWFFADFTAGGRLEGLDCPEAWRPLPEEPQV